MRFGLGPALLILGFLGTVTGQIAAADPLEEVRSLKRQGLAIFEEGRAKGLSGKLKAQSNHRAIEHFEKALAILEAQKPNEEIEALQADLSGLVYWTRKSIPLDFSPEGQSPPSPPEPSRQATGPAAPPAPAAGAPPPVPVTPSVSQPPQTALGFAKKSREEEVKTQMDRAERFAAREAEKDPFAVSLVFFEVADRFTGTPQSLTAIERARFYQAEARKKVQSSAEDAQRRKSLDPNSKAVPLLEEGKKAYRIGDYASAIERYEGAVAAEAHLVTLKALGRAHFEQAKARHLAYATEYEKAAGAFKAAEKLMHQGLMQRAKERGKGLEDLASAALEGFAKAREAFQSALKAAPEGRDLDAQLHLSLTYAVLPDEASLAQARKGLERVLAEYRPDDMEEQLLYEFAKTMHGHLLAGGAKGK
mgnify:CR=1 FL=1